MEVVVPVNPMDFDFNSSAYASAPATPKFTGGDCYFSAPTSPTRITELYREFDELLISHDTRRTNSLASVPFAWEEKPGVPKSLIFVDDFAFDVSGELGRDSSVSAEDLFQGGVIKPREVQGSKKEILRTVTMGEIERGRERGSSSSSASTGLSSSRSRRTRSLSPLRGSEYRWQEERAKPQSTTANTRPPTASTCSTLATSSSGKGSRKWSFKDLFLFRSASDGRAMDRDPLKKYSAIFRKHDEDFRNASIRSIENARSGSGSGSKRRGRVSAHEWHYQVNRAVSNDMKKKTFLPYKQGILGRLAFNPTVHALSNGFGFSNNN